MLYISTSDRAAGVAAFVELIGYMQKTLPEEMHDLPTKDIHKEAEEAWDNAKPNEREVMLALWQSTCAPGSYYECHLTFPGGPLDNPKEVKQQNDIAEIGAKYHFAFSKIDGDEVFGAGIKCYLTRSLKDGATLANDMNALTLALTNAGIPILRRKIEHIIFDERRDRLAGTARAA